MATYLSKPSTSPSSSSPPPPAPHTPPYPSNPQRYTRISPDPADSIYPLPFSAPATFVISICTGKAPSRTTYRLLPTRNDNPRSILHIRLSSHFTQTGGAARHEDDMVGEVEEVGDGEVVCHGVWYMDVRMCVCVYIFC